MKELDNLLNITDTYLNNKVNILKDIHNDYSTFNISYNVYEIALSDFRNDIMLDNECTDDNKLILLKIINLLANVL